MLADVFFLLFKVVIWILWFIFANFSNLYQVTFTTFELCQPFSFFCLFIHCLRFLCQNKSVSWFFLLTFCPPLQPGSFPLICVSSFFFHLISFYKEIWCSSAQVLVGKWFKKQKETGRSFAFLYLVLFWTTSCFVSLCVSFNPPSIFLFTFGSSLFWPWGKWTVTLKVRSWSQQIWEALFN